MGTISDSVVGASTSEVFDYALDSWSVLVKMSAFLFSTARLGEADALDQILMGVRDGWLDLHPMERCSQNDGSDEAHFCDECDDLVSDQMHQFAVFALPVAQDVFGSSLRYRKAIISPTLRKQVFERDAYRCQFCEGWEDLTVDHILAERKGGPTILENLQTLCRPCNSRKGMKLL